jgi:hypothetical protein
MTIRNDLCSPLKLQSPRETMHAAFPGILQRPLTAITGQPFQGEVGHGLTPWHHLGSAVFTHLAGTAGTWFCIDRGGPAWLAVPFTTLLALHGARKLRNVIMHQCAHDNFIRRRWFDRSLGKAISIALVTEEFDWYQRSHIEDHHSSRHQTISDPTVAFLFKDLGLRPGMATRTMWGKLFGAVISPTYHARFLAGRIKSHFKETSAGHRICLLVYLSVLAGTIAALGAAPEFLLSWVLPVTVLYQTSTAFRLCSRHIFVPKLPRKRDKATLGSFTLGIFIGAPCPETGHNPLSNLVRWMWWWARMLFYHIPCRLGVLVGDGPAHDFHHRFPRCPDWSNYAFARAGDQCGLDDGWPPYREVWGLHRAIDATFRSLSDADPADYPIEALYGSKATRKPEE